MLERFAVVLLLFAPAGEAAAYTCALSPAKDAVIIQTSNPSAEPRSCTVTCRFAVPAGIETVTCTQSIPPGTKDWYVCLRPTNGKAYGALESGKEDCKKP